MVDFLVLVSVVFAFGLVSRRLEGTILTPPIVFVAAGMVLGPAGLGVVQFGLDLGRREIPARSVGLTILHLGIFLILGRESSVLSGCHSTDPSRGR